MENRCKTELNIAMFAFMKHTSWNVLFYGVLPALKKFFRLYLLNLNCNNCNSNKPNDADVYNLTIIISWYKANLN